MKRYVAFLRGINVGGVKVKMAGLKACFEDMGFQDVSTVLQTGNVLFSAPKSDLSHLKNSLNKNWVRLLLQCYCTNFSVSHSQRNRRSLSI